MKRTAEQLNELEAAIAAGKRRIVREFTPEQREAWRKAAEEEQANKEATIARYRKVVAAAAEPGFFGDLRRALNAAGYRIVTLPDEVGVDCRLLDDFRAGDAELPSPVIARLVSVLGLRLMQEIPPVVDKLSRNASA